MPGSQDNNQGSNRLSQNKRVILCLSGGGFRATLFHLGVFRWFYEEWTDPDRNPAEAPTLIGITGVSGGSFVASRIFRTWGLLRQRVRETDKHFDNWKDHITKSITEKSFVKSVASKPISLIWDDQNNRDDLVLKYANLVGDFDSIEVERPMTVLQSTDLATGEAIGLISKAVPGESTCVQVLTGTEGSGAEFVKIEQRDKTLADQFLLYSSAYPALFPAMLRDFPSHKKLLLTDGGVIDNAGILGAMEILRSLKRSQQSIDDVVVVLSNAARRPPSISQSTTPFGATTSSFDALMARSYECNLAALRRAFPEACVMEVALTALTNCSDRANIDGKTRVALMDFRTGLDRFTKDECDLLISAGFVAADLRLATKPPTEESKEDSDQQSPNNGAKPIEQKLVKHLRRSKNATVRIVGDCSGKVVSAGTAFDDAIRTLESYFEDASEQAILRRVLSALDGAHSLNVGVIARLVWRALMATYGAKLIGAVLLASGLFAGFGAVIGWGAGGLIVRPQVPATGSFTDAAGVDASVDGISGDATVLDGLADSWPTNDVPDSRSVCAPGEEQAFSRRLVCRNGASALRVASSTSADLRRQMDAECNSSAQTPGGVWYCKPTGDVDGYADANTNNREWRIRVGHECRCNGFHPPPPICYCSASRICSESRERLSGEVRMSQEPVERPCNLQTFCETYAGSCRQQDSVIQGLCCPRGAGQ